MNKRGDKTALDRGALKSLLGKWAGEETPLERSIFSESDMVRLMDLWEKTPGARAFIEARMAEISWALDVNKVEELPEWLTTIVSDEMRIPLSLLRVILRRKAREICPRL